MFRDTFRLIKSTFNRFAAIFAIVLIGVAFMMGLLSNYDIMKESVETFYDDTNLYDAQLYSNYGFDDNDIKAIEKLDYVDGVFASKTRDVYCTFENEGNSVKIGNNIVVRVMEINDSFNKTELLAGRMPKKSDECVITIGYGISDDGNVDESLIGQKISLFLEDEDIDDSLNHDEFVIVGIVNASEYMCKMFSTSILDNNPLSAVVYISDGNFYSDYYTTCYINFKGSKELNSFSEEYGNFIDLRMDDLEKFGKNQSSKRRDSIIEEANKELEEAELEFEEKKNEGKEELDAAKEKLDKAEKEISDGEKEITANEKLLKDAKADLAEGQEEFDEAKAEYENVVGALSNYGLTVDSAREYLSTGYDLYQTTLAERENAEARRTEIEQEINQVEKAIADSGFSSRAEVEAAIDSLDPRSRDYEERLNELNTISEYFSSYDSLRIQLLAVNTEIETIEYSLSTIESTIQSYGGTGNIEEDYNQIQEQLNQLDEAQKLLDEAQKKLDDGQAQIEKGTLELEQGKIKLEQGKKEYEEGLEEYNKGLEEYNKSIQDAEDKFEDAKEEIKSLEKSEWTLLTRYKENYSFHMYKNTCGQMQSIGVIMPILFFIVAALVCSTTMTRLIDEQRGQIGIYRALGFKNREITARYLLYVLLASLSASIIATGVGVVSFPRVIYYAWGLLYNLPKQIIFVPIDKLLISVFCFAVLMLIVTKIVIAKSLREKPSQLLRPKAPKNAKKILLERIGFIWKRVSFTSKVTIRNIVRYKSRFFMTVIGIASCTGLLVLGWGVKDSVRDVAQLQFSDLMRYNYEVYLDNDRHLSDIINSIKDDENNEIAIPHKAYITSVVINDKESSINVDVVDANSIEDIHKLIDASTNSKIHLPEDGVLITEKYAKNEGLKVGDIITIESSNKDKADVTIKGIIKNYVMHYMYISSSQYQKLFNEKVEYNQIAVRNNGDTSELHKLTNKYRDVNNVGDFTSYIETFDNMIFSLNIVILVILVTAGALAFVILINLINVNISERRREIASLKVLGFRKSEINSYIFKEVILLSIIGSLLGLPLGKVEVGFVMTMIDMEEVVFPRVVNYMSYVYAFGITMLFTIIVFFFTKKVLRKIDMVESLKSVE